MPLAQKAKEETDTGPHEQKTKKKRKEGNPPFSFPGTQVMTFMECPRNIMQPTTLATGYSSDFLESIALLNLPS